MAVLRGSHRVMSPPRDHDAIVRVQSSENQETPFVSAFLKLSKNAMIKQELENVQMSRAGRRFRHFDLRLDAGEVREEPLHHMEEAQTRRFLECLGKCVAVVIAIRPQEVEERPARRPVGAGDAAVRPKVIQ
ncbi:hypothetical protein BBJ28_00023691 [Nothophytophthora sp. Chile5]|nr:hypothetical protein BBJ28_00023691 [Nothophytophthora sp. Chile5]